MVTIVSSVDWLGIYVDGELKYQSHNIDPERLLSILKIPYTSADVDDVWLDSIGGRFPRHLSDVVLEDE